MSSDRDSRGGRGRGWIRGVLVAAFVLAGCSDDDATDVTLGPLDATGVTTAGSSTDTAALAAGVSTTPPAGTAGAGYVSIQVRLPAAGIDETLSLDRATVSADALDPVNLDAFCTPLDGGAEMAASVVDLRRLSDGSRLISAALSIAGGVTAGEHDATLVVSGADQSTTTFIGTAVLEDGGWSGTFEAADASGNAATGGFTCASAAVETTTTQPTGSGEEVPETTD